jgi:hypothetical protein
VWTSLQLLQNKNGVDKWMVTSERSQGTKRVNRNCSLLTLVATSKRNILGSFKSNATNINIEGKMLKYYMLEMSV